MLSQEFQNLVMVDCENENSFDAIIKAIEYSNQNLKDDSNKNIAHYLAKTNNIDLAFSLTDQTQNDQTFNDKDKHGFAPIHYAVLSGNIDMVDNLLIRTSYENKHYALFLATMKSQGSSVDSQNSYHQIMEILLQEGISFTFSKNGIINSETNMILSKAMIADRIHAGYKAGLALNTDIQSVSQLEPKIQQRLFSLTDHSDPKYIKDTSWESRVKGLATQSNFITF